MSENLSLKPALHKITQNEIFLSKPIWKMRNVLLHFFILNTSYLNCIYSNLKSADVLESTELPTMLRYGTFLKMTPATSIPFKKWILLSTTNNIFIISVIEVNYIPNKAEVRIFWKTNPMPCAQDTRTRSEKQMPPGRANVSNMMYITNQIQHAKRTNTKSWLIIFLLMRMHESISTRRKHHRNRRLNFLSALHLRLVASSGSLSSHICICVMLMSLGVPLAAATQWCSMSLVSNTDVKVGSFSLVIAVMFLSVSLWTWIICEY